MNQYHEIKNIHQVLIVDSGELPDPLPEPIKNNINTIKTVYPDVDHKLWSSNEIRLFLKENFEEEVLWAYDTLKPYAYKCDLARLAILYMYGGIYCDIALNFINKWNIPTTAGFSGFRDVPCTNNWLMLQNGLIWSLPRRKELKLAINLIIENCRKKYYGTSPLHPSGPVVLGTACALVALEGVGNNINDQYIGQFRIISPIGDPDIVYVCQDGTIIASRLNKPGGELRQFKLTGVNNHNEFWRAHQVYGEKEYVWDFRHPSLGLLEEVGEYAYDGISAKGAGRILYGPYCDLRKGKYRLHIFFSKDTTFSKISVKIVSNGARKVICNKHYKIGLFHKKTSEVILSFKLKEDERQVEFLLSIFEDFSGKFLKYELVNY